MQSQHDKNMIMLAFCVAAKGQATGVCRLRW